MRAGLLVCVALLAACSTTDESEPAPEPAPSTSSSAPAPTATTSATTQEPDPPTTEPLVIAVHVRRPPADLTRSQAGLLVDGGVTRWSQLGLPGGLLTVTRKPRDLADLGADQVAIVPAHRVGPGVRVLSVDGVDPLRDPDDYLLRVVGPAAGRVTTLSVVGDIMLGRAVGERAAAVGDPSYALRPMATRLAAADVTVGNLESTLSTDGSPTQGGDSFAADPRVVAGLRDAGFDAVSLANNHTGDYGDRALVQTVRRLAAGRVASFGAGRNLADARRPVTITARNETTFGFIGFNAIGETPAAGPRTPGASSVSMPPRTGPLDRAELGRVLADVRRVSRLVDVMVVMPHWGTQYTERPEPVQEYVARQLVRAGADLVVGGHPHWVQGATLVGDALVVQSLGNFAFDMTTPETNEGLVLEATYWDDTLKGVDFVPYRLGPDHAPRVVPYDAAERVFANFWRFSGLGA